MVYILKMATFAFYHMQYLSQTAVKHTSPLPSAQLASQITTCRAFMAPEFFPMDSRSVFVWFFLKSFCCFYKKTFGKGLTDLFSLTTFSPQYVGQIKKVDTEILMCDFLGKKLVVKTLIRRSLIGPDSFSYPRAQKFQDKNVAVFTYTLLRAAR